VKEKGRGLQKKEGPKPSLSGGRKGGVYGNHRLGGGDLLVLKRKSVAVLEKRRPTAQYRALIY